MVFYGIIGFESNFDIRVFEKVVYFSSLLTDIREGGPLFIVVCNVFRYCYVF
jgi:hypothetical protein